MIAVAVMTVAGAVLVVRGQIGLATDLGEQKAVDLATLTASATTQFTNDVRELLGGIARHRASQTLDPTRCGDLLEEGHAILPNYVNLFVVSADTTLVCSAIGVPDPPPPPARAWWDLATHPDSGFVVSAPMIGGLSAAPVMVFALPILGSSGERIGYAGASVHVDRIYRLITAPGLPDGSVITVSRIDGLVVARSEGMDEWVGRKLPDTGIGMGHALAGVGVEVTQSADGVQSIWGYHTVDGLPWIVYAGVPLASVRRVAIRAALPQLGLLLFLLILPGLLGARLITAVGGAVDQILAGAKRASREGTDVPEVGPDELRQLAREFNTTLQDRDRAVGEHRSATGRLLSIVENASFGIYLVTEAGQIAQANPALARMLGYPGPGDMIGMSTTELHTDSSTRETLFALAESGARSAEVRFRRLDGTPLPVRLTWAPLTRSDGGTSYEVTVEDLSERYDLEQQIRQSQKLEAVGRLAGGVAHDFNNRLTVISGQAELLLESLPPGRHRDQAMAILKSARRSAELTSQLLAFSRKQIIRPLRIELNEAIRDVRDMIERLLGQEIELQIDPGPESPVWVDPGQLEQVVLNLCTNARDAMGGRGRITIETDHAELNADQAAATADADPGRYAVLTVSDTGHGIDDETRERIFEPFFTTKAPGEGTGLGLSTVYGIVAQAGGHLRVQSWPGRGTQFEIWFPLAPDPDAVAETSASRAEPGDAPSRGKGEVVLLTEDEEPVRLLVTELLSRDGYTVLAAEDGFHALALAAEHDGEIDLLVTDVIMPGMTGPELAERLTATRPDTRVLFISGFTEDPPELESHDGAPWEFLAKPFTALELNRRVRSLLDAPVATG